MKYDYLNKERNVRNMNTSMFTKSVGMFEYDGLPESVPQEELEKLLQETGYAFFYEHNSKLYALHGGLSGHMDEYNRPTEINLNNVYLNLNKTVNLSNGVLIKNDDYSQGLYPIYSKYNTLLNENEISMMLNTVNSRIQNLLSAGDDKTKASAEKFLKDIEKGELGVIGESQIFEGLKTHNTQSNNQQSVINLIEFQQYIKATMYNEIGIDLGFNMKRERLISGEVEQNTEILYPLVNNMYKNRYEAIQKLNEKYGLNVTLKYGSIWKERDTEKEVENNETTESDDEKETEEGGGDS